MQRTTMMLLTATAICGVMALPLAGKGPSSGPADQPQAAATDPFMGEYAGTFASAQGPALAAEAKVFPVKGIDRVVLLVPAAKEGDKPTRIELQGKAEGGKLAFSGKASGDDWAGAIENGQLAAQGQGAGGGKFDLKFTVRKSPAEGQKPPPGAAVLLPFEEGKETSLDSWDNKTWKVLPDGSIEVGKGDIHTVKPFGSAQIHVEFMCPYMPAAVGQARGNSGVYLHDRYEVQVLDSFGLPPADNEVGGIYKVAVPKVNAALPPLRWQTYDIEFHAPQFDASGKKLKNARVAVLLNGVKIHDNVDIPKPTGGARGAEAPTGPLRLQDHRNPVKYRNVWLVELKD